jgi:NAD(P)-dependent dehydrogenase (short-subunit alcohol dehydrogenase family)
MTHAATLTTQREPELLGQTVVVIGGSSGIGFETARRARQEGAEVVLAGREPDRLRRAATELDARGSAAFDATDPDALAQFFRDLPDPIDHVMVTAGRPHYGSLLDLSLEEARGEIEDHVLLVLQIVRDAAPKVRPGGALLFMGGTAGRRPNPAYGMLSTITVSMPTLVASLALAVAPARVNLIAAGFVDTPLSAELLGGDLDRRRAELRATLPIGRVVQAADVAALAVHLMVNTALTGATYDIDGGQQLVAPPAS